jgi:hypothetical protein
MDRLSRERDDDPVRREPEAPAPEAVQAGSLAWASAIGNQAVQRLARQELETEEGEPEEVAALTSAGLDVEDAAGLAAVDDLAEDELPE